VHCWSCMARSQQGDTASMDFARRVANFELSPGDGRTRSDSDSDSPDADSLEREYLMGGGRDSVEEGDEPAHVCCGGVLRYKEGEAGNDSVCGSRTLLFASFLTMGISSVIMYILLYEANFTAHKLMSVYGFVLSILLLVGGLLGWLGLYKLGDSKKVPLKLAHATHVLCLYGLCAYLCALLYYWQSLPSGTSTIADSPTWTLPGWMSPLDTREGLIALVLANSGAVLLYVLGSLCIKWSSKHSNVPQWTTVFTSFLLLLLGVGTSTMALLSMRYHPTLKSGTQCWSLYSAVISGILQVIVAVIPMFATKHSDRGLLTKYAIFVLLLACATQSAYWNYFLAFPSGGKRLDMVLITALLGIASEYLLVAAFVMSLAWRSAVADRSSDTDRGMREHIYAFENHEMHEGEPPRRCCCC